MHRAVYQRVPRPGCKLLGAGPHFLMNEDRWKELTSFSNLLLAYRKAAKGKRGLPPAARFEYNLEERLFALQEELASGTYLPGGYHHFFIHEPKRRLISAAPFRDRVIHHALCNVIEPAFERSFIVDCYANRVGKGTHRSLDKVQQLARRYAWVLQCDVRQFFPSIDHRILLEILFRKIPEKNIRELCSTIVRSGENVLEKEYDPVWFPGDDLLTPLRTRGLPIGNLTSQFWANCYLNGFDHFVKRELQCSAYVRYVDDFMLFANDKEVLWEWKLRLETRLATLRLSIHRGAQPHPVTNGLPFLGFVVCPERRRLKRRKGIHFVRKYRRMLAAAHAGEIPFVQVSASVRGWVNHVSYANTYGLRKSIFCPPGASPPDPP